MSITTTEKTKQKSLELTGKIVRVSDVAKTKNGTKAVHGSIIVEATGGKNRNKSGDAYHQFSAYGKAAEAFANRKPGAWLAVSYTNRTENYKTKAGEPASKNVLIVSSARFAKQKATTEATATT